MSTRKGEAVRYTCRPPVADTSLMGPHDHGGGASTQTTPTPSRRVRVVVVDDNAGFRESLLALLEAGDLDVVGEARSGPEALELVPVVDPDVVLMDVRMPDMDGIQTTRRLKQLHPSLGIVALSGHEDQDIVREMLVAGASGYVLKDSDGDEILSAVLHPAPGGGVALSPGPGRGQGWPVRRDAQPGRRAEDPRGARGERARVLTTRRGGDRPGGPGPGGDRGSRHGCGTRDRGRRPRADLRLPRARRGSERAGPSGSGLRLVARPRRRPFDGRRRGPRVLGAGGIHVPVDHRHRGVKRRVRETHSSATPGDACGRSGATPRPRSSSGTSSRRRTRTGAATR